MSKIDQCPSTKGREPEATPKPTGRQYWRSVEEFSNSPEFRPFIEREFPSRASELLESSRRTFVKLMGASLALAGAASIPGCRRPVRNVMPYSKNVPEEIIPGRPLYYASAMPLPGGGAEGLLIETHQARPTHIQGNPLHPINQSANSVWSVGSILDMYDVNRLKYPEYSNPARGRLAATWDDFKAFWGRHEKTIDGDGSSLAFIVEKKSSPSRNAMRDRVLARFPGATWVAWNPAETRGAIEGSRLAFGKPMRVHHDLSKAAVVLSLDSDFTNFGPEAIRNARLFSRTRRVNKPGDAMSRLYVAESAPSCTGSLADHRFQLAPSQITALAVAVANELMAKQGPAGAGGLKSALASMGEISVQGISAEHVRAIAEDLINSRGRAVVMAGPSQPAEVHALVWAMNAALNAIGSERAPGIVWASEMDEEIASDSGAALSELAARMDRGEIKTLVCIGTNPVYDAPAGMNFGEKFDSVEVTICWSVPSTETASRATWSLNGTHYLEAWGDVEAWDGTLSVSQPMIAPLYDPAMSELELLAFMTGEASPDGYEVVSQVWSDHLGLARDSAGFDKTWRRVLQDGLLSGSGNKAVHPTPRFADIAGGLQRVKLGAGPTQESMEVVFAVGNVGDGRHANNGWLQELPDPTSKVTWTNPAYVSPATAKALGLLPENSYDPYIQEQLPQAKMAELAIGKNLRMEISVWILPGMPENTIRLMLGYGRTVAGKVGDGVGFNTYVVREAGAGAARGATLSRRPGTKLVASTQNHWSMESRTSIVRALDRKWWEEYAGKAPVHKVDRIYGAFDYEGEKAEMHLKLAERLGELEEEPPALGIYNNPMNASHKDAAPGSVYSQPPQWGMSIDLASCTGCGVCTIACQSENNIPIVGSHEVAKGREMQWIRVDRYFTGEDLDAPDEMFMQPVPCMQCENAPCETVCPVTATVHGPEGTNNMAYNRCIGTRYCANNCPYKVRRFNFFDWGQTEYNGGLDSHYVGKTLAEGSAEKIKFNENLIPPRLRQKVREISKMQHNPNVTVRSRGVMEKCSYCIQRINRARQEVKRRKIWTDADQKVPIPDGFFETACQAACPTESIVFGDILDESSRVREIKDSERTYMLLGYLDTRPRTTYAMRVRNPNDRIRVYDEEDPFAEEHGGGAEGESAFVDPRKQGHEQGYALSLRVLGAGGVRA